jgi:hypothetical protein
MKGAVLHMLFENSYKNRQLLVDAVEASCNLQFIVHAGEERMEGVSFQALDDVISFGPRKAQAGGFPCMPHQS